MSLEPHLDDALEALEHAHGEGLGGGDGVALHVEQRLDHERRPDAPREGLARDADQVQVVEDLHQPEQRRQEDDELPHLVRGRSRGRGRGRVKVRGTGAGTDRGRDRVR